MLRLELPGAQGAACCICLSRALPLRRAWRGRRPPQIFPRRCQLAPSWKTLPIRPGRPLHPWAPSASRLRAEAPSASSLEPLESRQSQQPKTCVSLEILAKPRPSTACRGPLALYPAPRGALLLLELGQLLHDFPLADAAKGCDGSQVMRSWLGLASLPGIDALASRTDEKAEVGRREA